MSLVHLIQALLVYEQGVRVAWHVQVEDLGPGPILAGTVVARSVWQSLGDLDRTCVDADVLAEDCDAGGTVTI